MKVVKHIVIILLLTCLAACGGGDSFRVSGEIEGLGTQNLNIVYYGDGAVRSMRTALVDGKFMFEGASRDWTTVYIFSSRRALLGMVIARNGENIQLKMNTTEPQLLELKGNKHSELLGQWLAQNSEALKSNDATAINLAVKEFVEANSNSIVATVILTNFYRPRENMDEAETLYRFIDSKARPTYLAEGWVELLENARDSSHVRLPEHISFLDAQDSLIEINSRNKTLLLYAPKGDIRKYREDSLLRDRLRKIKKDTLNIAIFEIDREVSDTGAWKKNVRNDSLPWKRLWHPFNASKLPFEEYATFIVSDDEGGIIYNGNDIWEAIKAINVY